MKIILEKLISKNTAWRAEQGLFFFHGVSIDHETFKTQVEALKVRYRVVVWDMPYHGLSSPIDYKLKFSATDAVLLW